MELVLPPQLEALVEEKLASGRYASADAVLQEALHLLDARDRQEALKAQIQEGKISGPSEPLDMATIKAEARARRHAREQA